MNPTPQSNPQRAPAPIPGALAVAARLALILAGLAALIARAFLRNPRRVSLILPLWNRLTRAAARFTRLATRLEAGQAPRPSRKTSHSGPAPIRLPSARGWLVADLRHEAVAYANYLEALLADPIAANLLAASPTAARMLRPLCHMLGLANPAPPPEPPPAPARASRAEAPPHVPPPAQHRLTPPCPHLRWPWRSRPA